MDVTNKAFIKGTFSAIAGAAVLGLGSSAAINGVLKALRTASEETANEHNPFSRAISKASNVADIATG